MENLVLLRADTFDMEHVIPEYINTSTLFTSDKSHSGTVCSRMTEKYEYSLAVTCPVTALPYHRDVRGITVEAYFKTETNLRDAHIVLSIEDSSNLNIRWYGEKIQIKSLKKWESFKTSFFLDPEALMPGNSISVYIWNKGKDTFYVDDIIISYKGDSSEKIKSAGVDCILKTSFHYDLERTEPDLNNFETISTHRARSGKRSSELDQNKEYSIMIKKKIHQITCNTIKKVTAGVWIFPIEEGINALLVLTITRPDGEVIFWEGKSTDKKPLKKNTWQQLNSEFKIPFEKILPEDEISIYVWNKGQDHFFVDDLDVTFGEFISRGHPPNLVTEGSSYAVLYKKGIPPFPFNYFNKRKFPDSPVKNKDGSNTDPYVFLNPGDKWISGNFYPDRSDQDELLVMRKHSASLYYFCPDDSTFHVLWEEYKTSLAGMLYDHNWASGDFNGDRVDEITAVGNNGMIISCALIFDKNNSSCPAPTVSLSWDSLPWYATQKTPSLNSKIVAGDLSGDHRAELLLITPDSWEIMALAGSRWIKLAGGDSQKIFPGNNSGKTMVTAMHSIIISGQVRIAWMTSKADTLFLESVQYYHDKKTFLPDSAAMSCIPYRNGNFVDLLTGNYDDDPDEELLVLTTDTRFDIKLINRTPAGFEITNQVDFTGYDRNENPKYYELAMVASGYFEGRRNEKSSLLISMKNSGNTNVSGNRSINTGTWGGLQPNISLFLPSSLSDK